MLLPKNMDCLLSPGVRKPLAIISILFGFLCLFLLRYFQSDILKIIMLYITSISAMCLAVLYKNSINKYEISIFFFSVFSCLRLCQTRIIWIRLFQLYIFYRIVTGCRQEVLWRQSLIFSQTEALFPSILFGTLYFPVQSFFPLLYPFFLER